MKNSSKKILITLVAVGLSVSVHAQNGAPTQFNEATIAQLEAKMRAGTLTSVELTKFYLARIAALDQSGTDGGVNAIIELNPDALAIAQQMDDLRAQGTVLGPLHGIPVLIKDNIDTHDKMQTTAGSFALFGTPAPKDSTVAANLRLNGAVILGKTNLSEWANFRSFESTSGWSGRGGQTNNPYALDRNPCGSSAGSGAAASANLATVSLGSETDGSNVCPGNANGVVALRPTVGLVSRAVVVTISHEQDTVGANARTVPDADSNHGTIRSRAYNGHVFATRVGVPVARGSISTATQFNRAHADVEMPFFNQDIFIFCASLAQGPDTPQPLFGGLTYNEALQKDHNAGVQGIDKALKQFNLDAIVAPTDNPAWETDLLYSDTGRFYFASSGLAAPPGYPIIQVPAEMVLQTPMGISFIGTAFSEPTLIKLASGWESFTQVRAHNPPKFLDNTPSTHINGTNPIRDTDTVNPADANRKHRRL